MCRTLRVLLLCLLVLAVPVQGFAAAMMRFCHGGQPMSSQAHSSVATKDQGDVLRLAHEGAPSRGKHVSITHGKGVLGDATAHGHEKPDSPAHTAAGKCSGCAACCAPMALPASIQRLPAAPTQPAWWAPPVQTAVSFLTGGPERPPRRLLA